MGSGTIGTSRERRWWWKWQDRNGVGKSNCINGNNGIRNQNNKSRVLLYFVFSFFVLGSIVGFYTRYVVMSDVGLGIATFECRDDNEGSWDVCVYYGESPFSLKFMENKNVWNNKSAEWHVANPVITCPSFSHPLLYVQGGDLYMFYEAQNAVTMQGDIGVSQSIDNGATWHQLGIALDEDWHLSFPFVFDYNGNIYMMPQGSAKGDVRLYRATHFPMKWKLDRVILKKPLVDSVIIPHENKFWLFGSDNTKRDGHLEIWHSTSPLGPWKPHTKNPIYETMVGARNGGRPFEYNGNLYRIGHMTRVFKVEILTTHDYKEVEVPFSLQGPNRAYARNHRLDVQQLGSDEWIAIADGDQVPSRDPTHRFLFGLVSVISVTAIIVILLRIIAYSWRKRSCDAFLASKLRFLKQKGSCVLIIVAVSLTCAGVEYLYGGSGAQEPHSQFTLLTMTYDARLLNLKMYVKHYSRCSSVREIVVVWNRGVPPSPSDFDSAVPLRVRVEERNSLNNRFRVDPLIETRAVLELDDDLMMTCDDVERGFKVWAKHPVGFYPRLAYRGRYIGEQHARRYKRYNMILTGAAFMDHQVAFERYWSEEAAPGRALVDVYFNCEDVLMNYMYANRSFSSHVVEYVMPKGLIDMSSLSGVAISRNMRAHYRVRSKCLREFSDMYGSLSHKEVEFSRRRDG